MKDPRRLILLIISLALMIISGTAIIIGGPKPQWSVMLRAGLLLGVIWLALPDLSKISLTKSWPFLVGATLLAITIVSRPKLVPFALIAFVAILVVNFVLRTVARALVDKQRRK